MAIVACLLILGAAKLIRWEPILPREEPPNILGGYRGYYIPNYPISHTEPDPNPAVPWDAAADYRLEFGRGSGMEGLDTVAIQDGKVTLHWRIWEDEPTSYWQTVTMELSEIAIKEIGQSVEDLKLLELHNGYHAEICDGVQWVFWIEQGGQSKSIYFNNHFPESIQKFAVHLDRILDEAGLQNAQWQRVPDEEQGSHDQALWKKLNP